MQQKLVCFLFFMISASFAFGQNDSIKIFLNINGNKQKFSNNVNVQLFFNGLIFNNRLNDSLIVVDTNKLKNNYVTILFEYKRYKFTIEKVANMLRTYDIEFVIITKKFEQLKKTNRISYVYYLRFYERLTKEELEETLRKGVLHSVLRTEDSIVYKKRWRRVVSHSSPAPKNKF